MEMLFFLLTGCVLELCLGECGQQFRGRLGTLRLGIENRIEFFLLIYSDIPILFKTSFQLRILRRDNFNLYKLEIKYCLSLSWKSIKSNLSY